jgi:hypothetical protein
MIELKYHLHVANRSSLETGVTLLKVGDRILVRSPGLASASEPAEVTEGVDNLRRTLEELHTEAARNVEWDMAMHEPCTRVVRWESNDEVSSSINSVSIAADGVIKLERGTGTRSSTIANNPKVVAVKMDRVRKRSVVLDEPEGPASTRDGKPIVVGWKRVRAICDVAESRSLPIDVNSFAVHLPKHTSSGVQSEIKKSRGTRWRRDCSLDVWNNVSLLDTAGCQVVCRGCWVARCGTSIRENGTLSVRSKILPVRSVALSSACSETEPVVANWLVSVYDDIVALA